MIQIKLYTQDSFKVVDDLKDTLSAAQLAGAVRRGINLALRKGRTQMRKDIREEYAIKQGRVYSSDDEKGLKVSGSKGYELSGMITAGHKPVGLAAFGGVRQNKGGVGVEIHKGKREQIASAFLLPGKGNVVFAHGKYSTYGFIFSRGAVFGRARLDALNSPSVATMLLNKKTQNRYADIVVDVYESEVIRQIDLLTHASSF